MKLIPYKEAIKLGKDAKRQLLAPIKARKVKKQGELGKLEISEKIAVLEAAITERCSHENVDFDSIIDMLDELALLERRLKQFENVINQLFPEE